MVCIYMYIYKWRILIDIVWGSFRLAPSNYSVFSGNQSQGMILFAPQWGRGGGEGGSCLY